MHKLGVVTLLGPLLLLANDMRARAEAAAPPGEQEAVKAAAQESAKAWLALVDRGDYGGSWEQAAKLFRNAVTKESWENTVRSVRDPLGAVKQRQAKAVQYATSLPGAPDGQYVVIQYETAFENKAAAIETVTPMLEHDGSWRISGYYIK